MPSGNPSFSANTTRSTGGASQAGTSRPAGSSQVGSQGMGGNTSGRVGGAPAGGGNYGGSIGSNTPSSGSGGDRSAGQSSSPSRGYGGSTPSGGSSDPRAQPGYRRTETYSGPKGVPSQGLNQAAQQAAQNARDTSRLATAQRQRAAGVGPSRPSLAGKVADLRNSGMALTNRELAGVQSTARRVWDARTPGGGMSVHRKNVGMQQVNRAAKRNATPPQTVNRGAKRDLEARSMIGAPSSVISTKGPLQRTVVPQSPAPAPVSNVAAKANQGSMPPPRVANSNAGGALRGAARAATRTPPSRPSRPSRGTLASKFQGRNERPRKKGYATNRLGVDPDRSYR